MQIAHTVEAVATLQHPLAIAIMDRSTPLTHTLVERVMSLTQFSWHGRKPTSGVDAAGKRRATNLDLLSVLMELYKRQARVKLRGYQNQLPWQAYAGEQHIGGTARAGVITGLISHRSHLSFSVRIRDESVLSAGAEVLKLGADRSYMLANHAGNWSAGWRGLTWECTKAEALYFGRKQLWHQDTIDCVDYVHHNRRQSIFGAPYLLLKLLLQRIEDELAFYEREQRRLETLGVVESAVGAQSQRLCLATGASRFASVPTFTMELVGPEFTGGYASVSSDELGYKLVQRSVRFLAEILRPKVQFMVRADEVAFYRFGRPTDFVAHWIKGPQWIRWTGGQNAQIEFSERLALSYHTAATEIRLAA